MASEYQVSLSFAGEDREIAKQLADALTDEGIAVVFDQASSSELWGADLYKHFQDIFTNSKICIVLLSEDYGTDAWTKNEFRNLQAQSIAREGFTILPVRESSTSSRYWASRPRAP